MLRILFFILIVFITSSVHAQEKPSYVIELEQIEASPEPQIESVSEEVQKKLEETGFILTPPDKDSAFLFSITDTNVDFSDINTARNKTNSTLIRVNSEDPVGYQIIASLKQQFQSSLDETIPQINSTNKDSYGWGFQVSGPDIVLPLKDESRFQIFDEDKQVIFSENNQMTGESTTKLTIKVQIPAEQREGNYTGAIKIIAIPKL